MQQLINYLEAAKRLGLSPQTLRKWVSAGNPVGIPYIKIGGAVRFDPERLDAWVREHAVEGPTAPIETPEDGRAPYEVR